jgi:hypothetical protein
MQKLTLILVFATLAAQIYAIDELKTDQTALNTLDHDDDNANKDDEFDFGNLNFGDFNFGDLMSTLGSTDFSELLDTFTRSGGLSAIFEEIGGLEGLREMMREATHPDKIAEVAKAMKEQQPDVHNLLNQPEVVSIMKLLGLHEVLEKHLSDPKLIHDAFDQIANPDHLQEIIKKTFGEKGIDGILDNDGPLMQMFDQASPFLEMFKNLLPKKKRISEGIDLDKFVGLVDQLGGVEQVAKAMRDMGLGEMLEKAGGIAALQALLDEKHDEL